MKLTKNFTLEELIKTNHNVNNLPSDFEINSLKTLCEKVLQPIRDKFGYIRITSGYRSAELNKLIGGSTKPLSQHTKGEAVDFRCVNPQIVFEWIRENLEFDQLINEYNYAWIHVSFSKKNRKEVLECKNIKGKKTYIKL